MKRTQTSTWEFVGPLFPLQTDLYCEVKHPSADWYIISDPRWDHVLIFQQGSIALKVDYRSLPWDGKLHQAHCNGRSLPILLGGYQGAFYGRWLEL
jgi:hypothetical protein